MKSVKYLGIALTMGLGLWCGYTVSYDPVQISEYSSTFGEIDNGAVAEIERYLRYLPKDARAAWTEYAQRVSKIHSGSNETIESANWQLVKSPCFSDVAARFYTWLLQNDVDIRESLSTVRSHIRPLEGRPTLADRAGQGLWRNLPPGELWKKALELSGGNGNLALAVIGLCGHDDAVSEKPSLLSDRTETNIYLAERKRTLEIARAHLLEKIRYEANPENKARLQGTLDGVNSLLTESKTELFCHNGSSLYVPQALGPEVDVDSRLKERIIRAQAPNRGGYALPAKGYHFIGSAMNACLLRARTMTSIAALVVNPMAARMYRAKTLAPRVGAVKAMDLSPYDIETLTEADLAPVVEAFNNLPKDPRPPGERMEPFAPWVKFLENPKNAIANLFPHHDDGRRITPAQALSSVRAQVAQSDAGALVGDWWTPYTLPLVGRVYLPSRRNRPDVRNAQVNPFGFRTPANRCERDDMGPKRCAAAIAVLDTWEMDFAWSTEQHFRGAKFGYENCRALSAGETLETLACQALQNSSSGTPASAPGTR